MALGKQNPGSGIPEVNLIPMLDVLMSVLTFFVILTMTLSGVNVPNLTLPGLGAGTSDRGNRRDADSGEGLRPEASENTLLIAINKDAQILIDSQVVSREEVSQRATAYLEANPEEGSIILQADRTLPYRQVLETLLQLQAIGGERVSLAIGG